MLNQRNFEIAKLASDDEEAGPSLHCILVTPNKTVATDGHVVIEMTGFQHSEDILPFEDMKPQHEFEPFLMPAEEALALSKVFIKSDSKDANLIAIQPKSNGGTGTCSFGLKQPKSEKVFRVESPGAEFPNYEVVFPDVAGECGHVTLNLDLLIPLLQQLKKVSPTVRFGFYGDDKVLRLDANDALLEQSARAGIMPMKA